ncbi:reverse transcriptase [Aphelenchoides avenae]|nr:reverse transcriptase [Aphelenchus avenae]
MSTPVKPPYLCSAEPPSLEEVEAAVRKLKNGKAAGEDGVQPELLKALPPMAVETFIGALKSYKILERIFADRLSEYWEKRTREEQAGFRPGSSTTDQIFVLRRALETRNRYKQPLTVAFLDYACAFDSPDRERVYELLRSDGVQAKIVELIRDMNSNSAAVARTCPGHTRPISVATGVMHRSVLAPMLFNFVIDTIMNEAVKEYGGGFTLLPSAKRLTDLDYADDLVLLSDSREVLQRLIDRVAQHAERFGLRLKPTKCNMISTLLTRSS